ncbi:MAG: ribonuclease HII [Deltaproteobacteria bacterium]|nr:ribonuclease HII [Deltaproteobacteria bacterium]
MRRARPSSEPSPPPGDVVLRIEDWAREQGYRRITGVDEAGRGPLAGPVIAAAVLLPGDHGIEGLADSKKLSARHRERLDATIRERAAAWGLGRVDAGRIDAVNIRRASLLAMTQALAQLLQRGPATDIVIVDGLDPCDLPPGFPPVPVRAFKRADARCEAVSAASILAKVQRDAIMRAYHERWPSYGFDRHMGYPTAAHKRALAEHGPCAIHRRSFRGVV